MQLLKPRIFVANNSHRSQGTSHKSQVLRIIGALKTFISIWKNSSLSGYRVF